MINTPQWLTTCNSTIALIMVRSQCTPILPAPYLQWFRSPFTRAGPDPAVTAPIIGARNLDQLEGSLGSLEIDMTPELRAEISALSPEPPPATDRSEEGTAHSFSVR